MKSIRHGAEKNWAFRTLIAGLMVLGFASGWSLSWNPHLKAYKLLALEGQILTLLGLLVLSEVLATEAWKRICVRVIAPGVLWSVTVFPFGGAIGGFVSIFVHAPSGHTVAIFGMEMCGYSILAGGKFNDIVVFPRLARLRDNIDARWKWSGFLFLVGGVVAQLIAAAMDLLN